MAKEFDPSMLPMPSAEERPQFDPTLLPKGAPEEAPFVPGVEPGIEVHRHLPGFSGPVEFWQTLVANPSKIPDTSMYRAVADPIKRIYNVMNRTAKGEQVPDEEAHRA